MKLFIETLVQVVIILFTEVNVIKTITDSNHRHHHHRRQVQCIDPTNLHQRLYSLNAPAEINLIHQSHPARMFQSDTNCPEHVPTSGPVSDRSTCPWYFSSESDPQRFPHRIVRAVLKCGIFCRIPLDDGRLRNMAAGFCQPVYDAVKVLRFRHRCNAQGVKIYRAHTEHVPIAYTCVFPRRRYSG